MTHQLRQIIFCFVSLVTLCLFSVSAIAVQPDREVEGGHASFLSSLSALQLPLSEADLPDIEAGVQFLMNSEDFRMTEKDAYKLLVQIAEHKSYHSKFPLERQDGFHFYYRPQKSLLPQKVKVGFDFRGEAMITIPGKSKKRGATKVMDFVIRSSDWKPLARLEGRDTGISLSHSKEIRILEKISTLPPSARVGLISLAGVFPGGFYLDLFDSTLRNRMKEVRREPRVVVGQILSGLASLHSLDIIHGDLHPGNILVKRLANGQFSAVISDFDVSIVLSRLKGGQRIWHDSAYPRYMAPDLVTMMHDVVDLSEPRVVERLKKRDVFSMGIVLHKIFEKSYPPLLQSCRYRDSDQDFPVECYKKKFEKAIAVKSYLKSFSEFSWSAYLLEAALDPDADKRVTAVQLLQAWEVWKKFQESSEMNNTSLNSIQRSTSGEGSVCGSFYSDLLSASENVMHAHSGGYIVVDSMQPGMVHSDSSVVGIVFKDSRNGVRHVLLPGSQYSLSGVESVIQFLKDLGFLKESLK